MISKETGYRMASFGQGPRDIVTFITGVSNLRVNKNYPLPDAWQGGNAKLGRDAIIMVAESMKEIFGADVWAKYLLLSTNSYQNIVIDDLRFLSEYDVIKHFPHKIIRVICEDEDRISRAAKHSDYPLALIRASEIGDAEVKLIPAECTINTSFPVDIKKIL
jgi:hypothetical protein